MSRKHLFPFVAAVLVAIVMGSGATLRADDKPKAAPDPKCDLAKLETIQQFPVARVRVRKDGGHRRRWVQRGNWA